MTVKYRAFLRVIAVLVVCLFLADSVSWAYPDISAASSASRNDLQVQSIFDPVIKAAGWERAVQIKLELACIMKMALDPKPAPFQDINAEIDKWLSASGTHPRLRALDVMSNPLVENGCRVVEFCVFAGPDAGRVFRMTMNCSSLEEAALYPDRVTIEAVDRSKNLKKVIHVERSLDDPVVAKVKDILGKDLKGRRILELGIGTLTNKARGLVSAGAMVTAVDFDDASLAIDRRSFEETGVEGVTLRTMDFTQPFTFDDGEFDAIVFSNILDFVFVWGMPFEMSVQGKGAAVAAERVKFFAECLRVLKPGGIVAFSDVADPEYSSKYKALHDAVEPFYKLVDIGNAAEKAGFVIVERNRSFIGAMTVLRKPAVPTAAQIGKRSHVISVDTVRGIAVVEDAEGNRHEITIVHDGMVDVDGLKQRLTAMDSVSEDHKAVISSILTLVRNARPENYIFETLIDDLAAFAWPQAGLIAMHQAMAGDPVAVFHEIAEYLAKTGALKLRLEGAHVVLALYGGEDIKVPLSERTLEVVAQEEWKTGWQVDPHYLIRALQIEMFGSRDKAVSRKIALMQRFGGSSMKLWTFTSSDIDDMLNLSPFAAPEELKVKIDKLLPGAFPDAPVEGAKKLENLLMPVRIDGKYEPVSILGAGGMGVVLKAKAPGGSDVAIKIIEMPESPGRRLYLLQEYFIWQEAQRVDGIIKLYDAGSFVMGGIRYCFIVQEFADGGELIDGMTAKRVSDLFDDLEAGKEVAGEALSVKARDDEMYSIARQLLNIVRGLHSRGIIHADITPRNIFRFKKGNKIKVGDLGISAYAPEGEVKRGKGGTLDYQSAETIWTGKYTLKTDLFAVGCDLYEVVYGEPFYLFPENLEGGILMDAPRMLEGLRERSEKIRKLKDAPKKPIDQIIAALLTENIEIALRTDGTRMLAKVDRGGVETAAKAIDILEGILATPKTVPAGTSGMAGLRKRRAVFDAELGTAGAKTPVAPGKAVPVTPPVKDAGKSRRLEFEDTGRLMVSAALDKLLGEKLAGQVELMGGRRGVIAIDRSPSLKVDASGMIVSNVMGGMWNSITIKPEYNLSHEFLITVQKTYYLAALYEFQAKLAANEADKAVLLEKAAKLMKDAADELDARGVKEPLRAPSPTLDYLVVRRNVDLLGLFVLKLKKTQEKTVVFAAGADASSFGITVDVDVDGHIQGSGSSEGPVLSYSLIINPMDETLEGLPSKAHPNIAKAVEQYNQAKRRSSGFVREPRKPKRDDRPTMKIDPEAGENQIGKMARVQGIDDVSADGALNAWKAARVENRAKDISYVLLEMQGTSYFETLVRYIADARHVGVPYRAMLLSMLELVRQSPPEMSVFDDYVEDLFGFARPEVGEHGIIGLHKDFAGDPIAELHEVLEHIVRAGLVRLEFRSPAAVLLKRVGLYALAARTGLLRGEIRITDGEGRELGKVALKGEALSIAFKNPIILHNLIRAMQREVFGALDRDLTARIKTAQMPQAAPIVPEKKVWVKVPIKGVIPMPEGFGGQLFTIGDVHGDLEALRETLEGLGLIKRGSDEDGMDDIWTGGTSIVVQGGDVIDRGPKSIEVLLYMRRLQAEAYLHQGSVVRLIGNHELFYLLRHDKGRWKGQIDVLKKEGYFRGFDENLWKNDRKLLEILREDILKGRMVGAYQTGGKVFVHAAVLDDTLEYLGMESEEDVTQPKTFCAVVNKILKSSVRAGRFDSVIFAVNGAAEWHTNGIFSEYPSEMVLKRLGYPLSVVQSLSFMSVVKIIKKEAGSGSEDVDKFTFDQVVFHDPRLFMGLLEIGVIKGKRTERSLVCADVGMGEAFGSGRASVLFEGGGVYKVVPKAVTHREGSNEYLDSLSDFKVGFITGALSDDGMKKLREETRLEWLKNPAAVSRVDGRVTNFDICMLPILERVPSVILSGNDWGIFEFNEDGIGYGTAEIAEFVRFTKEGRKLIGELIRDEEEEFFGEKLDYLSRVKIMLPEFPSATASSEVLLQRGTKMVLKAVAEGHARPHTFVSQSELRDPDGPMAHDSLSLRVVIGLLDHVPEALTETTKREDWYWVPRKDSVKFINRATGEIESVKYSSDREISGLPETARVKAVLSSLRKSAANRALNFMDGLAIDEHGTLNDRIRYELMRDSMESVPLAYDHPLVFEAVSAGENIGLDKILTHRFIPRELRLMYAAQTAFPRQVGDHARTQSFSYRPGSTALTSVIYYGKNGSRYRNPSLLIPPYSGFKREHLTARVSSSEITVYLALLDKGYLDEMAYVNDLIRERARALYDATSEGYLKLYASFSWETEAWDGYKTSKKQAEAEFAPGDHFLFSRVPPEDSSQHDFVEHIAAYVLFGPQFRKAAERSKALSAKYDFIKERIFKGFEYQQNYDFSKVAFGLLPSAPRLDTGGTIVKDENSPDMAGDEITHRERNKALAALIEAGRVYRMGYRDVTIEKFRKGKALTFAGRVLDLLNDVWTGARAFVDRIALKFTVHKRLSRIRESGLVAKAAFDRSFDVAALAESLVVSEDAIREGLSSAAFALNVLVVKDRLALYDGGPIAHTRRAITRGQGGAAIWLGEKLFTSKDVKDEDIARLLVEETLHFLYPEAGHDVIRHSKELALKLTKISKKIGEKPGQRSCEADMAQAPKPAGEPEKPMQAAAGDVSRKRYDLPASLAGAKGVNLIEIIEETLDEQFGGKKQYLIIPFGSAAYLRDKNGKIAWEYLRDVDVQVVFFEDMGIARRRGTGMGGGLVADFRKQLAANLEKRGAKASFADAVDISFEDEILTEKQFNLYFNDVMPYMVEVFGGKKALADFGKFVERYKKNVNLLGRYESIWSLLQDEDITNEKRVKILIAMAAIRGDDGAVRALMSELDVPDRVDIASLIKKYSILPEKLYDNEFLSKRVPAYGASIVKGVKASLEAGQQAVKPAAKAHDEARGIEQRIKGASLASRHLFRVVQEYLKAAPAEGTARGSGRPIDVLVDLSLIPKDDLAENMETWAYLVLMCRNMENVNFIFEIPTSAKSGDGGSRRAVSLDEANAPLQGEALARLSADIKSRAVCLDMPQSAEEFIKCRVNTARRDGAVEVAIMSKNRLQLLRSTGEGIKANQYPVALDGISRDTSDKVAMRHFEAALTIGLTEAAFVIAAGRVEAGEKGAEAAKDEFKKKTLEKLQKVYSFFREDVKLTEKTLDNMVSPYAEVRTNLAISLALPPIVRMAFQKLLELHNGLQLFLQAA